MGATTTFADLIAAPNSEKVFLAEVQPAEHLQGWTLTTDQTYTYKIAYLNETITLSDSTTETIRKAIVALEQDGTALTVKTSIAEVEATASTYWHDTANGILYAHVSDDGSPDDYTMVGYFWLYFATKGIVLNSIYYEPYIAENGIPRISQSTSDIHWGVSQISVGEIIFENGRGFFDQIAKKFIWHNKTVKILFGGDALPYSEYVTLFTVLIVDLTFTKQKLSIGLRSNSYDLLGNLPTNDYWTTDYANLQSSAEGKPIPLGYGTFSGDMAPSVTCINTAYGASTYQFKICDTTYWPIKSITQVYVNYGAGAGWQTIAHANEDLNAATFTITSASFVVGTSQIKVAFEGYHDSGTLIEGAPEIVEDILIKWCGYSSADLNAASFTTSEGLSDVSLAVWIDSSQTALSVIEKICKSDLAFFDEDADGLLRYRTWEPTVSGTLPVLNSLDILNDSIPEIVDDSNVLYWKVKVGYAYDYVSELSLYAEASSTESRYKYNKTEILTYETYLRTEAQASILAARLNWITRNPSPTLSILLKASQINKLLGDKLKITLARAPNATAGGYAERVFEIISKELSCFPEILTVTGRDLMEFGNDVGWWMADSAPAWAAATTQERDDSGFWADDDGYIVTGDETTKNKSRWW